MHLQMVVFSSIMLVFGVQYLFSMNHMKTSVTIGLEISFCLYAFFHQQYEQLSKEKGTR